MNGSVTIGVGLAGAGAASLAKQLYYLDVALRSTTWRMTTGRIIESHIGPATVTSPPRLPPIMIPQVHYTYEVAGKTYQGRWITFRGLFAGSARAAAAVIRRYPEKHAVTVWYDPGHPDQSVLEPGAGVTSVVRVAIGAALTAAGVYVAWSAWGVA